MLLNIIFFVIDAILKVFSSIFPVEQTPTGILLPYGTDNILQTLISYYNGAIETLPHLQTALTAFGIIILFELIMLVMKLILGSRTPVAVN